MSRSLRLSLTQQAKEGVQVKLLAQDAELYVLAARDAVFPSFYSIRRPILR